jgi:hypothetical protein
MENKPTLIYVTLVLNLRNFQSCKFEFICFNNGGTSQLTQDKILQFETSPHSVMQEILATLYWGNTTNKSSTHLTLSACSSCLAQQ